MAGPKLFQTPLAFMFISVLLLLVCIVCVIFNNKKTVCLTLATISGSLLYLVYSYIVTNTQLLSVYLNSSSDTPTIFKVAAAWSNHEGSMLLWGWVLSLFNTIFCYANSGMKQDNTLTHSISKIQAAVTAIFIVTTIYSSNPFIEREASLDGLGFNPILQDVAVTSHPPLLFISYGAFSMVFSITLAAIITGGPTLPWLRLVTPWLRLAWGTLSIAIGLGSWWAYRELGWGGFWFWDPVENISLMPWLLATAMLHSMIMVKHFGIMRKWTMLLGIMPFISIIIGTFLIRSGLLISIHSFTFDGNKGFYLTLLVLLITLPAILAFIICTRKSYEDTPSVYFPIISLPTGIMLNNLFLCCSYLAIVISLIYPILENILNHETIGIGTHYYNTTFLLLWVPMTLICGVVSAPMNKWIYLGKYTVILGVTALYSNSISTTALLSTGIFTASCSAIGLYRILRKGHNKRLLRMNISHLGIGVLMIGIAICTSWQKDVEIYMKPGGTMEFIGHKFVLNKLSLIEGPNYKAIQANLSIDGKKTLLPESRFFTQPKISTPEPAILHIGLSDICIMIGNIEENLGIALKIFYRPGIQLIWLGLLITAISTIYEGLSRLLTNPKRIIEEISAE